MKLIWHGTAAVEVVCARGRILFDPFVPLPGAETAGKIDDYDGFTDIFVTHGHFDHIADLPEIVKRNPGVRIYCTRTPCEVLRKKGVPASALVQFERGQTLSCGGFRIRTYPGRHARLPKATLSRLRRILRSPHRGNLPRILRENRVCRENGETVFYHIEAEGVSVSLMGSLNLREDTEYPTGADLLVLPYNGWEDNYPPAAAVLRRLRPKRAALDHYDNTFPPLTEPLDLAPILNEFPGLVAPMEPGRAREV